MSDLLDLQRRVAEATGPDRELDRALAVALGVLHEDPDRIRDGRPQLYRIEPDAVGGERHIYGGLDDDILVRRYTLSMDAALALVERCGLDPEQIAREAIDRTYEWVADVPSFPQRLTLAILSALLAALPPTTTHKGEEA